MNHSLAQIEKARGIVNDIAEDIDNRETRQELRQALSIYADLLMAKCEELQLERSKNQISQLEELLGRVESLTGTPSWWEGPSPPKLGTVLIQPQARP